jgi:propanol-preferring alcohol dehydrogenase
MKAMVLNGIVDLTKNIPPLVMKDLPDPVPGSHDVLIKISACGVCHTEIDEIEGRTPPPRFPVIPGHQVVGRVIRTGERVKKHKDGDRVGVAWIFSSCGVCEYCRSGFENLCPDFRATGRDKNGGYAELMVVPEDYAYAVPGIFSDSEAAPLLCAGTIGYRSVRLCNLKDGQNLGLTGFGASAHLVLKMVRHAYLKVNVFVFSRNKEERAFAASLGAVWTGDIGETAPEGLHSIIDTTPVWKPVVEAMKSLRPGGRLVINAIRKEDVDKDYLKNLDYTTHLWMEKEIKSVANVTRADVNEFLALAAQVPIKPDMQEYPLEDANHILTGLKQRRLKGAMVLKIA